MEKKLSLTETELILTVGDNEFGFAHAEAIALLEKEIEAEIADESGEEPESEPDHERNGERW